MIEDETNQRRVPDRFSSWVKKKETKIHKRAGDDK